MTSKRQIILNGLVEKICERERERDREKRVYREEKATATNRRSDGSDWSGFAAHWEQQTGTQNWADEIFELGPKTVGWYPSCGCDFSPLHACRRETLGSHGVDPGPNYCFPDLWIFSDMYGGLRSTDWPEAINAAMDHYQIPGGKLFTVEYWPIDPYATARLVRFKVSPENEEPFRTQILLLSATNEEVHHRLSQFRIPVKVAGFDLGAIEGGSLLDRCLRDPRELADLGVEWLFSPRNWAVGREWIQRGDGIPMGTVQRSAFLLQRVGNRP